MDDNSLVDDFFLQKPTARKQSALSPATSTGAPRPSTPINKTPTAPRVWAETIPRRPKEQPRSIKPTRPRPCSTSTPRRPIYSSKTIRAPTYSPTRSSVSLASPPPLPPPLDFSSPTRSGVSTGLSTTVSPSIVSSSTRKGYPASIPSIRKSPRKPARPLPSPCAQLEPTVCVIETESDHILVPESDGVLVPDSTDAPQELPSTLLDHNDQARSELDSHTHVEHDYCDFRDNHDPLPQKLFKSSPSPPPKLVSRPFNGSGKDKGKARELNSSTNLRESTDEDGKRAKLLADLGFEEEEDTRLGTEEECVPFSSSPIEIVGPSRTAQNAGKSVTTKSDSKGMDQWKKRGAEYSAKKKVLDLSEWEEWPMLHPIPSGSSLPQDQHTQIPSQEDQIKHIGLLIDDSEDEDDGISSGIAPLMDSWPADKRGVFLKMAGLKSDDVAVDEAGHAQAVDDWDRLLKKGGKRNVNVATKVAKKTWYNRSFYRAKKRGSKAFKAVGRSTRRVK